MKRETIYNYFIDRIDEMFEERKKTIIVFGSSTEKIGSDFDACIILEKYTDEDVKNISTILANMHNLFKLKLDIDIPYSKKSIFTYDECIDVIVNPPFFKVNNKYIITDIIDDLNYLNSDIARKRLLVNILTSDNFILKGSEYIENIKLRAISMIINVLCSYLEYLKIPITYDNILHGLYQNPSTKSIYKDYLGYKEKDIKYLSLKLKTNNIEW